MSPKSLFSQMAIQLNDRDNIAIARAPIPEGTVLVLESPNEPNRDLKILGSVPVGHKFSLVAIPARAAVYRCGQPIGNTTQAVQPGEWVHTHNLEMGDDTRPFEYQVVAAQERTPPTDPTPTFQGYRRPDGRVGTRNYIVVMSSVSCAAQTARAIADHFTPEMLADFPNVDGVLALVHHSGCSTPLDSLGSLFLQRTQTNLTAHPNVGGAVYISLGCEGNQVQSTACNEISVDRDIPVLTVEELGGIQKTVRAGIAVIEELLPKVNAIERSSAPISEITMAVQCGGSDGWSGVTANPLMGKIADRIVLSGGTVVLAETPEIFGAEQLLLSRCGNAAAGQKLIERISWWQNQARLGGFSLDQNPTPGNKAGGLTTIFEKSLGAVAKGGGTPLQAVYEFAERVDRRGLVFMDTPGYDPVSVTGQVAGGSNLVLFSTGRGSVFGGNISPCIKVASNTAIFDRILDDMDFNAGQLLEGKDIESCAGELFELILQTSSGNRSKSELKGFRESEFIPWHPGTFL